MTVLSIERLTAEYHMPRGVPSHDRLRFVLDDMVRSSLAHELASALGSSLDAGDGVWIIDRLELDVSLDLAAPGSHLARAWAERIADAISRALEHDAVARFESRAAFVGRFLSDLAMGRAFGKWYYREFEGLRALPRSHALRTAIVDAPVAHQALCSLPSQERARILDALVPGDAERVAMALAAAPGCEAEDRARVLAALMAALSRVEHIAQRRGGLQDALALYLAVVERDPEVRGAALLAFAREVVDRDVRMSGAPGDAALAPISSAAERAELVDAMRLHRSRAAETGERRHTLFGGMFMLLPLLDELRLEDYWPDPALGRLVVLVKAAGAVALFGDPLWRDVMGIAPELGPAEVAAQLAATSDDACARLREAFPEVGEDEIARVALPELAGDTAADRALGAATIALLRRFAHRLPGFAASSPSYVFDNFLDARASLERDGERHIVRLGRPPIHAVLAMTRLPRARFVLSWRRGSFELYGED
jgi:hypothetical protein